MCNFILKLFKSTAGLISFFSENGQKINANNADFEYAVAAFRASKHLGVSFGIIPFTNVGYNYSISGYLNGDRSTAYTNTYNGSGGIVVREVNSTVGMVD